MADCAVPRMVIALQLWGTQPGHAETVTARASPLPSMALSSQIITSSANVIIKARNEGSPNYYYDATV
jgi:hypothetical protein